jgi:hypothetical protein
MFKEPYIKFAANISEIVFTPNLTTISMINSTDNSSYQVEGYFFDEYFKLPDVSVVSQAFADDDRF